MVETKGRRGGRAARRALRAAPVPEEERPVRPGLEGGRYKPLTDEDVNRIHDAALDVLETIGLSQAIPSCIELLTGAGGRVDEHGRVLLPRSLVEDTVAGAARNIVLHGQESRHDMELSGSRVYFGTAGAAVHIVDVETSEVTRHSLTNEAYTDEQYHELLAQAGFSDIRLFPSLVGVEVKERSQSANLVVVGRK